MIAQTPTDERPRERCLLHGPGCLSLRECLALLLGSGPPGLGSAGLARAILDIPGPMPDAQAEAALFTALEVSGPAHLQSVRGLGRAGRARLLVAFELGRRYALHVQRSGRPGCGHRPSARRPERAALARVPPELRAAAQEWLAFVPVLRGGAVGELCLVQRGVRTHVNVDPAELFARVLALRPAGFYLFHNHPSGDLTASAPDLELTRRVADAARPFGIALLGHWVVSRASERLIEAGL
jgi:DNA repair protein RadC